MKPGHFKKTFVDSDEEEDGTVSKDKAERKMKRRQEKETKKAEKRAKKAEKRAIKERKKAGKASSMDQDGVGENVRRVEGEANGGVASANAEPNGSVASIKRDLSIENGVEGTGVEEHPVAKRKKSKGNGSVAASDRRVEEGKGSGKKASKKRDGEAAAAAVVSKAKKGKQGKGIEVKSKRKNCARADNEAEDDCIEKDAEGRDPAKRVKNIKKRKKKKSNVSLPSSPSDDGKSLTTVGSRKRSCGSEDSEPTSCDGGEEPGVTPRKHKLKKKAVNGSALASGFGDTEGGGRKKSSKRCKGEGQGGSAEDDSEAKLVSKKRCKESSKNKTKISNKVEFVDEEACSNSHKRSEAVVTASVDGTGDVQRQKKSKKMKVEAQGGVFGEGGSEQKRCGSLGGGEEGARKKREPAVDEPITSAERKVKKAKKAGGGKARRLENGGGDATAKRESKKKKRKTT